MKKLLITSLLVLPVIAMAATPIEMEQTTTDYLGTNYNYQLDKTARQHTADRWFNYGKGYRLSDKTRNRYWTPKNYSSYNAEYDTSAKDSGDRLYKKAVGEVDSVYVPGIPHNTAMNVKNRIRQGYFLSNRYNRSERKGDYRRIDRIVGKYNNYERWDVRRKEGQEFKNTPDMDISGNYKSIRWNPYRYGRYNYRRGEDASSSVVAE